MIMYLCIMFVLSVSSSSYGDPVEPLRTTVLAKKTVIFNSRILRPLSHFHMSLTLFFLNQISKGWFDAIVDLSIDICSLNTERIQCSTWNHSTNLFGSSFYCFWRLHMRRHPSQPPKSCFGLQYTNGNLRGLEIINLSILWRTSYRKFFNLPIPNRINWK